MSLDVSGDHTIRVRGALGLPVALEAVAMFTDGLVEGRTVGARTFIFEFAEANPAEIVITARLRHPGSANPARAALTPLYNLMAGLYRAGASVVVEGMLADLLPGGGTLAHQPAEARPITSLQQIFEDHLPAAERTPPVPLEPLAEAFQALDQLRDFARQQRTPGFRAIFPTLVKDHRDDASYYLTHRGGLEFVALVADDAVYAHGLHQHRPLSARLSFDFFDPTPRPARTWGEVWVNHAHGGAFDRPGGLEILPGEIALIHDIEIHRYTIDDRASLADLSDLSFGPGRSRLYSASVWLRLAVQYGGNQRYPTALNCAEQAALLDESAELNAQAQQEIERWQDWITFTQEQPSTPQPPSDEPQAALLRPLTELQARLSSFAADRLQEVCETIQYEHRDAHDYHRRIQPIPPVGPTGRGTDRFSLDYRRVTGRTMLDAGVTPAALAGLGYRFAVIPPPALLEDIFTIQCGDTVIWGNVETESLILRDEPGRVYSARPELAGWRGAEDG